MNAMKRVTSVARMRLVQTRKDLTNASANLVSMVTATTAQVSQCFIFLLKILNRITTHFLFFVCRVSQNFLWRRIDVHHNMLSSSAMGRAAVNVIFLLDMLLYS